MGAGKEGTAIQTGRGLTDRSLLGRRAGWGSLGLSGLGSQWSWGGGEQASCGEPRPQHQTLQRST